jgi:hypothetical protein
MKKQPRATKSDKRHLNLEKMQRRSHQLGGTKKNALHVPPPEQPTKPMPTPVDKRKKTGMISLRVERMTKRLVRSMKECPGASFDTHADACRMGTSTFYAWMKKGEQGPETVYGKFRDTMLQAMAEGEKMLHNMAARSTPIHVLTRRFPQHYPSERQLMELSAPGGLPLIPATENSFSVVIDIYPQQTGDEKPLDEVFRIVQPDGRVDLWSPPKANGQQPPHS